ncbi:hypothetical protein WJX75_004392 [Coccomyxa subellipsoidea]|uniref:Uncharacterized protein n=1 Tax=Coccomyxa subellipsoidea TaxID=248742 RepID=A0ABR2YTM1_9CHLO
MGSTLSALQSESSLRGTILSRAEILQLLNVRPGTHIWEALAAQGVHPQGPSGAPHGLAVALLEAMAYWSSHHAPGMEDVNPTGHGAVHRIDERRDDIVRDLHKRIKRAKMNGAAASRSEAVHRRSAEDANLALDEAVGVLEASMHASEDLRSRFAASQRTVGHLTRNLITAQLKLHAPKLHATTENSLSSSAALEAQEALLSRHQTAARVERREEALQQRILELKRRICRQRAATQRRLACTEEAA